MSTSEPRIQAARLRARRLELKLTQEELAERSGINQSTISQLERGEQAPTVRSLVALAKVLGTNIEWLLGLNDEQFDFSELKSHEAELAALLRSIDPLYREELVRIVRSIVEFSVGTRK